jgi:hypothetical protein
VQRIKIFAIFFCTAFFLVLFFYLFFFFSKSGNCCCNDEALGSSKVPTQVPPGNIVGNFNFFVLFYTMNVEFILFLLTRPGCNSPEKFLSPEYARVGGIIRGGATTRMEAGTCTALVAN